MAKSKYYSQKGQDRLVHSLFFANTKNGFFLDIGAHDGVSFSNTFFFETHLNWKGICVEPIPEVYQKLVKNRNCIYVNACIDSKNGTLKFTRVKGYGEMLSGISDKYDQKHKERINKTLKQFGGEIEEFEVNSVTVMSLVEKYNLDRIDLMNVDTEGNEWPIIQTFPFDILKPKVILVENNYNDNNIKNFLVEKGYTFCVNHGDDIFYHGKLPISADLKLFAFKLKRFIKYNLRRLFK
ncbi:FkbM family methyltransferase [Peijinzhouia sedimentorum]